MESIHVEGLRELRTALKAVDGELPGELRLELKTIGDIVARIAKGSVPTGAGPQSPQSTSHAPGAARDSIKVFTNGPAVGVRGGGASAVHFGWLDFGGHVGAYAQISRPRAPEGRYIYPAADQAIPQVELKTNEMLDRIFQRAGFV